MNKRHQHAVDAPCACGRLQSHRKPQKVITSWSRPRLSEADVRMICTGLRQYASDRVSAKRKAHALRLCMRLDEHVVGNPNFLFGPIDQEEEEEAEE